MDEKLKMEVLASLDPETARLYLEREKIDPIGSLVGPINEDEPSVPNVEFIRNPWSKYVFYKEPEPIKANFISEQLKSSTVKYGVDITAAAKNFLESGKVDSKHIDEYIKNQKKELEEALGRYKSLKLKVDQEAHQNIQKAEAISEEISKAPSDKINSLRSSLLSTLKYNFQDTQTPESPLTEAKKNVVRLNLQKPTLIFGSPHPYDTINKYLSRFYTFGSSSPGSVFKSVATIVSMTLIGYAFYVSSYPKPHTFTTEWKTAVAERKRKIGPDDAFFYKWKPGMKFDRPVSEALADSITISDAVSDIDEDYILGKLKENYSEFEECNSLIEAAKFSSENPQILDKYADEILPSEEYVYVSKIDLKASLSNHC